MPKLRVTRSKSIHFHLDEAQPDDSSGSDPLENNNKEEAEKKSARTAAKSGANPIKAAAAADEESIVPADGETTMPRARVGRKIAAPTTLRVTRSKSVYLEQSESNNNNSIENRNQKAVVKKTSRNVANNNSVLPNQVAAAATTAATKRSKRLAPAHKDADATQPEGGNATVTTAARVARSKRLASTHKDVHDSSTSRNMRSNRQEPNDAPTRRSMRTAAATSDEMCAKFGIKPCRIELQPLSASATATVRQESGAPEPVPILPGSSNDELCLKYGLKSCHVVLSPLLAENMTVDPIEANICRSPSPPRRRSRSPIYSPISTPVSSRASSADPKVRKLLQFTHEASTESAEAPLSAAASGPMDVYDFPSMSQEDLSENDDPMREVIAKLQSENRIELKRKRGRQPAINKTEGVKKNAKRPKNTRKALQQNRAKLVQLKETLKKQVLSQKPVPVPVADKSMPLLTAASPPSPQPSQSNDMPQPDASVHETQSFMAPPSPPPLASIHQSRAMTKPPPMPAIRLQPTHQSTPFPRMAAAKSQAHPTASTPKPTGTAINSTTFTAVANATGNASPWRVNDENLPCSLIFSTTNSEHLPTYSSDVLITDRSPVVQALNRRPSTITKPIAAEQTTGATVTKKRVADAPIRDDMDTQKRPKLSGAQTLAHDDQQQQKRLDFSAELLSPPAQETAEHADGETEPTELLEPLPQLVSSAANLSDIENVRPPVQQLQLSAKASKSGVRIVLGDRGVIRQPLMPLAIRNVILSPNSSIGPDLTIIDTFNNSSADDVQPAALTPKPAAAPATSSTSSASLAPVTTVSKPPAKKRPSATTDADDMYFGFDSETSDEGDPPTVESPHLFRIASTGGDQILNSFHVRNRFDGCAIARDIRLRRMYAIAPAMAKAKLPSSIFAEPAVPKRRAIQTSLQRQREKQQKQQKHDEPMASDSSTLDCTEKTLLSSPSAPETVASAASDVCRPSDTLDQTFSSFVRGVEAPRAKADHAKTAADNAPELFEVRWPEQHLATRKSYSRPKRHVHARSMEESRSDDEDSDVDDGKLEQAARLKKARSSKRKESEAMLHARELEHFAEQFNSMCEEVDQYDVIVERSA